MIEINRKTGQGFALPTRRTLRMIALATVGAIAVASIFSPSMARGQAATQPAAADVATTQPADLKGAVPLVAEGVGKDGKVRLMVNKTLVLTTTQPIKQVSVGNPEVADVSPIGPNNVLVTAKRP